MANINVMWLYCVAIVVDNDVDEVSSTSWQREFNVSFRTYVIVWIFTGRYNCRPFSRACVFFLLLIGRRIYTYSAYMHINNNEKKKCENK